MKKAMIIHKIFNYTPIFRQVTSLTQQAGSETQWVLIIIHKLSRLRALLEGNGVRHFADDGKKQQRFEMTGEMKTYNASADQVDLVSTQRDDPMEVAVKAVLDVKEEKRKAKEERKAKRRAEKEKRDTSEPEENENQMGVDGETKKEKKRKRRESEGVVLMDQDEPEKPKVCGS